MFHVSLMKNRFKLRVSDFNKIAEYLNNLCGGLGINVKRPDNPSASSPPVVEIDRAGLMAMLKELLASTEPVSPVEMPSGEDGCRSGNSTINDPWTAGGEKGLLIYLPCRTAVNNNYGEMHWRPFKIAPDGRIFSVGAEDNANNTNITLYAANP